MIEETARVVSQDGPCAWVETQRTSTCNSCAANKGCGSATLAKVLGQRRSRVRALNPLQAQTGERVVIGLAEQALVKGALAVYLVPLLSLLAGALVGDYWAARLGLENPDPLTIGLGGLGLAAGVLWLRYYARKIGNDRRYQAVVLRRLPPTPVAVGVSGP